eukprot:3379555-Prymnesium_polylepis.1
MSLTLSPPARRTPRSATSAARHAEGQTAAGPASRQPAPLAVDRDTQVSPSRSEYSTKATRVRRPRSDDGDVRARRPHLAGSLAVPPPAQHIIARGDARGDDHPVLDGAGALGQILDGRAVGHVARQARRVLAVVVRAGAVRGEVGRAAALALPRAVLA